MPTYLESIGNAAKAGLCNALNDFSNAKRVFRDAIDFGQPIADPTPFLGPLTGALCNKPPASPPPATFTGGQCGGVLYRVFYNGTSSGSQFVSGDVNAVGPIGIKIFQNLTGQRQYDVTSRTGTPDQSQINIGAVSPSNFATDSYQITSVQRIDGNPDNCGNPGSPDVPPAANNPTFPVNEPYNPDGGGPSINIVGVGVVGIAKVDVDANISIPVTVDVGGVSIPVTINLNGDINIGAPKPTNNTPESKRRTPDRRPGTQPGDYDAGDSIPDVPDEPFGEDDSDSDPSEERIIRAAVVTVLETGENVGLLAQTGGNPSVGVPNYGLINFQTVVDGQLVWLSDEAVKNRRNLIPCSWEGGAIAVAGTPRPGVSFTITPVYKKIESGEEESD